MKSIKVFMTLLIAAVILSCSKDEEPAQNNSDIIGEWRLEEFYYTGMSRVDYETGPEEVAYDVETDNINAKMILNADNTFTSSGTLDYYMTYEFLGSPTVIPLIDFSYDNSGNWSLSGSLLSVSNQIGQIGTTTVQQAAITEFSIEELTASRLVLAFDMTQEGVEDGLSYYVNNKGKQIFSR